ncbi:MAG: UDP-2,3-diacylglucosamine diphosphatase [Pseudomonadota bacterium]
MSIALDCNRPALCVSDLHLEQPDDVRFAALESLLRTAADRRWNLFLLGDLCEVWIGDDDDSELARAFIGLLERLAAVTWVGLMHGNRDFLYGQALAAATGVTVLTDPFTAYNGVLFTHGDALCVDDTAYQQMRTLFRSSDWQQEILAQPLAARRAFAASLRAESQAANANKASNIMDVNAAAVDAAVAQQNAQLMVHGHTHRPGRHDADGYQRIVLGDWARCAWVLGVRPAAGAPPAATLGCYGVAALAGGGASHAARLLDALGGPL